VWILLGAALLFNQVGLNFFHDRHDAHEFHVAIQKDQTVLLNHGEHCKVCSVEVLFNIVLPVSVELNFPVDNPTFVEQVFPEPVVVFTSFQPGRAPPAVS
jgi:hypothetical protein